MNFFKITSIDEAKIKIKSILSGSLKEELLSIDKICGRRLFEDVFSTDYLPLYDRSTMDGYALIASDVYTASDTVPTFLQITGKVLMGEMPKISVEKGKAVEIATGAILPKNATAVVPFEHVDLLKNEIAVNAPIKEGANIVKKGEELNPSDLIAGKGTFVNPLLSGVFASVGITNVKVYSTLNASIISTGDELVAPEQKVEEGKIRDVNTTLISSLLENANINVVSKFLIKDGEELLKQTIINALKISDIVILSGGSSIGARDYTFKVIDELGQVHFHGLSAKPGKPSIIGEIDGKLVLGLPGNPNAAQMVLKELLLNPLVEIEGGEIKPICFAYMKTNFPSTPGRTTMTPVSLEVIDNMFYATPIFMKSAHLAVSLKADGYVKTNLNDEGINKGELVAVYSF